VAPVRSSAWASVMFAVLWLAACGEPAEPHVYSVRAQVVRVFDGGRELAIDHEAIPGFMDAMQMSFAVRDPQIAQGLERGDKIRLELRVSSRGAWVERIEPLPADTPLALASGGGS